MSDKPIKQPAFYQTIPPGDTVEREVCRDCGFVHYQNPKVVVGSVATWQGKILLCRRAIDPRKGFWTLPAGFLELEESPEEGARREAREEACTELLIDQLLAIYSIKRQSQIQLIFRASLASDSYGVGEESLEVALFYWADIPWQELAFPSVHWALHHYRDSQSLTSFAPYGNPSARVGNMEELSKPGL